MYQQNKDRLLEIDEHIAKRFDVQKRIGKGAYGIVWKAVDRRSKQVVAVKKIFDAFRNQTDAQRTFREIMFLQSFKNHPNIIKLISIHRAANNKDIYLGFEYMETDLHNVIKRGNVLKDIHKRYIMYQLFKATKFIHSGNVIHRDQKPSNILIDTLCRCKLADFGLARSLQQISGDGCGNDTDPTLTDYVATRWYRAPEILIANRRYTKGIDMWSLGCILAEMIAGKPIFPGSSTVNQIEKIMVSIATPSQEDIHHVCVSGIGTSMIKTASSPQKVPIKAILGPEAPADAIDLVNKLLLFNPDKRLTADQSLKHQYVAKFHDPSQEIELPCNVIIPINDDTRLSVDDYRNKLYELMAEQPKLKPIRLPKSVMKIQPELKYDARCAKQPHCHDRTYTTQSEPKLTRIAPIKPKNATAIEPKTGKHFVKPAHVTAKAEFRKVPSSKCFAQSLQDDKSREKLKRRSLEAKGNVYMPFNSYSQTHGIITQSALLELKASGFR